MLAAFLVSLALALHHAGVAIHADAHHGTATAVEMCLGVLSAIGVVAAVVAVGVVLLGRRFPPACIRPRSASAAADTVSEKARDGPFTLSLLCVRRL